MQEISFAKGWNILHIQVAPQMSADELFLDWPVETVSLYDPAVYLDTRQYSATESSEGTLRPAMRIWRRGDAGASGFQAVPADSILMFRATNAWSGRLYGTPCAPRVSWHPTSATTTKNYVGVSTYAATTVSAYFSGAGVSQSDCALVWGDEADARQAGVFNGQTLANGMALAVDAAKVGDWSGVLYVSPRNGIDFGTESPNAVLSIRNDGAAERTVSVQLVPTARDDIPPPAGLMVRDALAASTNGTWSAFSTTPADRQTKPLAPGESWDLQLALDRTQLTAPAGTLYGALLDIRDEDGGSKMRVVVPLTATGDGGASSEYAWPKGVWLASAELDTVSYFLTDEGGAAPATADSVALPAGGRMKVRLPIYVDNNGRMTLLQRFWYGRDTNGVLHAYSGAVETSDVPLTDIKRVSSASLPADQPQVATASGFGETARFDFVVGEKSNVNPMRHAPHPRHDGLTADYLADAPSGDVPANYSGTVKPEAFSVTNRVELTWDENGATAWNPAETLGGTIVWEFDGLRHEGTVQARGRFAMKRLSPVTMTLE